MLVQTNVLNLKKGAVRLQFFKYPDEGGRSLPVAIEGTAWVKQKLWLQAGSFKRSVWLSPERAFSLYFYMHKVFLSEEQSPLYIVDDGNVVRVVGGEGNGQGVLSFIVESRDGKYAGGLVIDYEDMITFMSFLKTFAMFSFFVVGEQECIFFQRWGNEYLILHPIITSISLGKAQKARQFLKALKEEDVKGLKPVIFKELYGFKFVPKEGAFITTPTENIKLSQEKIEKLTVFFEI
jgi:hypothetical protein